MSDLFVMCGLSGSGKTTFAKKFAEENGLHYICPDDFYKLFNGDDRRHYNEFEIWMAIYRALHMAEMDGVSTVFDSNNPTEAGREQILEWFPSFRHHLIYIDASEDLCIRNNANRRRVIPKEEMARMISAFQPPSRSEDPKWHSIKTLENKNNTGFRLVESWERGEE